MILQHVIDHKSGHHYFNPEHVTDIYMQFPEDTEFYIVIAKFRIIVMRGNLKEMHAFIESKEKKLINYCKIV
jgi:hypothetical protein